jgi:hypothetical protein
MGQIVGVLFAILVGLMSVPSLITWQTQAKNSVNAASIAQQARQLIPASTQYIQTNAVALQASATTSTPVTVTVEQLQAAGVLSGAFKPTNLYNQTWQLQVLQPTAGNLQGMIITTGGDAISDMQAMQIARLTGYEGGFFPKNDSGIYAGGAANAYGANWGPLSAAGYTNQAGHLAMLINFNKNELNDNRLYRNSVPGQPQLNTMTTPILMSSVQTKDADCGAKGAIAADNTGALLICVESASIMKWRSPGSVYWKDPVSNFASLPTTGDDVGAVRMTIDTGRAFMWSGTIWSPLAVDQNGNLSVPGNLRVNTAIGVGNSATSTAGASCTTGSVAQSTTGGILYCDVNTMTYAEATNGEVVANTMQITGVFNEGDACPRGTADNGRIGRKADGTPLYCQSGRWATQEPGRTVQQSIDHYVGRMTWPQDTDATSPVSCSLIDCSTGGANFAIQYTVSGTTGIHTLMARNWNGSSWSSWFVACNLNAALQCNYGMTHQVTGAGILRAGGGSLMKLFAWAN